MKIIRISGYKLEYGDGSILYKDAGGLFIYTLNTEYHRENGPAVIMEDGSMLYLKKGKAHREDGPAVIWVDGLEEYWVNGIEKSEN